MRIKSKIAPVGAFFAEPGRAAILSVLFDSRARTAGELARTGGIEATAASGHLAKLVASGLLAMEMEGRHRYYRLAGPDVAAVIEDLAHLARQPAEFSVPKLSHAAKALGLARSFVTIT